MAQTVEFSHASTLNFSQGLQEISKKLPPPVSWQYIPKLTTAQFFPGMRPLNSARETCRDLGGKWQLKSCKIHLLNCDKSQKTICSKNILSFKKCRNLSLHKWESAFLKFGQQQGKQELLSQCNDPLEDCFLQQLRPADEGRLCNVRIALLCVAVVCQ